MEATCPNCGHHLVDYRTEQQPAGAREAILHWAICPKCRHVALQDWEMHEPTMALCGGRDECAQ